MRSSAALALLLLATPMPVLAQTFEVDATGTGTGSSFFEALSGELIVVQSSSTIDSYDGIEGSPLEGMTSRCFGSTTILRGIPNGSGNCVFTDPNGDKVLQAWVVDSVGQNRSSGTWHFVGGTGRHDGIEGRGHFTSVEEPLSGSTTTTISGITAWPEG